MPSKYIPSLLGRLLSEISWDGRLVKNYRNGGCGLENVLTTEVFQALDFLPRKHFLGAIFKELEGGSEDIKNKLYNQIEEASIDLLVGDYYLKPSKKTHQTKISVQPDGIVQSKDVFALLYITT